ncbi:hypothetical protein [Agaribacter marinus]|uniref:Outer membrane usher protein FimD/PapC n=1 Tax=Agaribacter marinus TaxID=1431249 RepID=A0AA37T1F8_9ALTE|nr:hypothetical protein [Agaribacter marinus]GLR70673.1 hypothetical protein GCM10007852_15810 [Agaribacter marinus]
MKANNKIAISKPIYLALICLFVLNVNAQTAVSEISNTPIAQPAIRYDDGEELLFSLIVNGYMLGELYSVVHDSDYFISFDDFLNASNFSISKEKFEDRLVYSGWRLNDNDHFKVEFLASPEELSAFSEDAIAIISESAAKYGLDSTDVYFFGEDLFIRQNKLGEFFKSKVTIDEEKLHIEFATKDMWPFEASIKRKNKKLYKRGATQAASEPHYDFGYFLKSDQTIDVVAGMNARQLGKENEDFNGFYSALGRQDILGLSARFYFSGNSNDALNSGNLDFSKFWLGEDTGLLGIRQLSFGDIRAVRTGTQSSSLNRGLSLSNESLNRQIDQQFFNIEGQVQNGWDIELYQNDVLIKQKFGTIDGKYEFLDIPLNIGLNEFEVVKYGPQGQIERESVSKFVDRQFGQKFEPLYSVSLTQNNSSLLGVQKPSSNIDDNWLFSGRYGVNINNNTQLIASHAINLGNEANNLYGLGLSSRATDRLFLNAALKYEQNSSQSINLSARTFAIGQSINSSVTYIESLLDESKGEAFLNTSFSLSGQLANIKNVKLYQQSEVLYIEDFSDTSELTIINRVSANLPSFSVNHSVNYQKVKNKIRNEVKEFITGNLGVVKSFGNVFTRSGLVYKESDGFELDSAFLSLDWRIIDKLSFRNEFNHNFDADLTQYSFSADWQTKLYALNAKLTHSELSGTSISLSARMSLSEAPTEFGYIQNRHSLTNRGVALVRVFHDRNNNGVYDAHDKPIKGAKVEAPQSRRHAMTDAIGIAQLDSLRNFEATDLLLDSESLSNPYLVHSTLKTSITPRPGLVMLVNYPLVEGAEVDGQVKYLDEYARTKYMSNAPIHIKDSSNNVISTIKTGFDGYFYYSGLVPHRYTLEVDKQYLEKFELEQLETISVNIHEQAQIESDIQITLSKKNKSIHYVARVGEFNTPSLLTSYYRLLLANDHLPVDYDETPFKFTLSSGKYSLGLVVSNTQFEADAFCLKMGGQCTVETVEKFLSVNGS